MTPSYRFGSPESGRTRRPSSRSMIQRTSLYWTLSAASPVLMVNARGRPVAGPRPTALTARTIASATCVDRISWGRYAPSTGSTFRASLNRSTNSTRAGDCASMTCTSVRWPNARTPRRVAARRAEAVPPRSRRRTCGSPGPVITGRYPPAPAAPSTYVRSTVVPVTGPRSAGAAAAGRAGNAASPVEAIPAPRAAPFRTRRRLYSRVTIVNQTTP
ncbi:hypothetical protein LUX33_14730 [Actinomadura madurae]|uniref:hypothetical protein n=1 Tax=Actinomadura madurae TaxID=1993 RepID=UPI0020D25546|nr:hypothetical protein [Actinomadura madurae]MCP9949535.1 hypothetical protein [Actinomadura madurae]